MRKFCWISNNESGVALISTDIFLSNRLEFHSEILPIYFSHVTFLSDKSSLEYFKVVIISCVILAQEKN